MTRILAVFAALTLAACSGDDEAGDCVEAEYSCSGDLLQQCVDGVLTDVEDCAAMTGTCDAVNGECVMDTMTEDTSMGTM